MAVDPTSSARRGRRSGELPPATGGDAAGVGPEERRRRRREFWITVVVLALIGALLLLQPLSGLTRGVGDSGLFLLVNALTVVLILLLGFLVTRNLWKIVGERRQGILGSRLNLRFVAAMFLIAFVATSGLFVASAFFIAQSIDKWFSVQVDRALEESGEVASHYYESTAENALFYGRRIAEQITERRLLRQEALSELTAFVQERQREYHLGVVEVFSGTGESLVSSVNPEIPAANFSRPDSELVRSALDGSDSWRVEEVGSGDVVRGAVPIASSFLPGDAVGAVVVNSFVPFSLARKVASIRATLGEYRILQPNAGHIRSAYLLELGLAFLVVLMLAMWMGLRLAKGVTGPIRALAEGNAEVARGNLDVVVEKTSNDEVGFLVQSFNRMTQELRDARARIDLSNAEREQRRRYMEVVLGTIGAGVVSVDAEGRVSTMNPSAQRFLGIPAGRGVIGNKLVDLGARPELLGPIEEVTRQLRPGHRENIRRQVQVPLGDELATLFLTVTLLHGESGASMGTVVVFDDYTQVVKVQRMAAWREVARRIAHEIKNPLTPIQLSAQRLRRRFRTRFDAEPDAARVFDECVEAITTQVESLKVLVDEFSNFARLPAARPEPGDLNPMVRDAVASYEGTEGVIFETRLDPELPAADLDREQVRRALINLIDNAISAARRRDGTGPGHVTLVTVHDAPLQIVRLEVQDDGPGISPEDRRRIFEPYFSTKSHGTGLGLAIVSRIVADHRGYIRVQQAEPRGTRFVIELPVRGA